MSGGFTNRWRPLWIWAMGIIAALVVARTPSFGATPQGFTQYPLPHGAEAYYIIAGPDGLLWFAEANGVIGRITPSGPLAGSVQEFPLSESYFAGPLTVGPDHNVWFVDCIADQIGRIDVSGNVSLFPIPTPESLGSGSAITAGPDGNLWFVESDAGQIARITPNGVITEFPISDEYFSPGIAGGPDGNIWFTESDRIARIHPQDGSMAEFLLPNFSPSLADITVGSDGNLWFTDADPEGNQIGRLNPQGGLTEFPVPTADSEPGSITTGADDNLWFTETHYDIVFNGNQPIEMDVGQIGRITPAGIISEFALPRGINAFDITAGPDGNLWLTQPGSISSRDSTVVMLVPQLATPISVVNPTPSPTPIVDPVGCVGDCNGDGTVAVSDLLIMVNVSLGNADVATCAAGDTNHNDTITIDEILAAVNHALNGCSPG